MARLSRSTLLTRIIHSLLLIAAALVLLVPCAQRAMAASKYSIDPDRTYPVDANVGDAAMSLQAQLEKKLSSIKYSTDVVSVKKNKTKKLVTITYSVKTFSRYINSYPATLKDDDDYLGCSVSHYLEVYKFGSKTLVSEFYWGNTNFWSLNSWESNRSSQVYSVKSLGNSKRPVYVQLQSHYSGEVNKP